MNKTKIDWADSTWNPITGCLHGCEYCYARKIAMRFRMPFTPRLDDAGMEGASKYEAVTGGMLLDLIQPCRYAGIGPIEPYPLGFMPTFHRYRLEEPARKARSRTIFVCSMADLFGEWVPDEWIHEVFQACERAPQHRFLFLTKHPEGIWRRDLTIPIDGNFWYGTTVSRNADLGRIGYLPVDCNRFVSIEPMLEAIDLDARLVKVAVPFAEWVIIGAETGNRKGRVIPERRWVEDVTRYAHDRGVKVFHKESLRGLMGPDFIQEYPWEAYEL